MFVSVIICTRNRANMLRETLNSVLTPANRESSEWEVLVVDNGSGDDTPQVCREFQQNFPSHFRSLVESKPGKSYALNSGIAGAKGDILAFADDDVRCAPNYISAIRQVFSEFETDGAQGRIYLECEGGRPPWLDAFLGLTVGARDYGDEPTQLQGTMTGGNMVVKASVFRNIGGFAPELGPCGAGMAEDTEISMRMRRAGCRQLYAPQIVVWHRMPRQLLRKSVFRRRFFRQGRAEAYYARLPVSLFRFCLYVVKDTILNELRAAWELVAGRPALALRHQCEARSHAGFFWQHWLFRRGVARRLTGTEALKRSAEPQAGDQSFLLESAGQRKSNVH